MNVKIHKPTDTHSATTDKTEQAVTHTKTPSKSPQQTIPPETGGRKGPEPTRYGDWEKNGRCIDF